MTDRGGRRAVRRTLLGVVALTALAALAGCQGAPSPLATSPGGEPTVTPAAVPDDPAPARAGTDSGSEGDRRWRAQPLDSGARTDAVLRNDRNASFVVELYVDPGGTEAVDVTFANGTTTRLDEPPDDTGVTGVNGSYAPFDSTDLVGTATAVRPTDADAVILPLAVRPGATVRGRLPPLGPTDTVLYVVRASPTRPGRPNPVRWVGVIGCPTAYLGLADSIEFAFLPERDGGLTVERECTTPP